MLLSGALSPALAEWAIHRAGLSSERADELLKPLLPVVLGGGWPWLMPLVRERVLNRLKKEDTP